MRGQEKVSRAERAEYAIDVRFAELWLRSHESRRLLALLQVYPEFLLEVAGGELGESVVEYQTNFEYSAKASHSVQEITQSYPQSIHKCC